MLELADVLVQRGVVAFDSGHTLEALAYYQQAMGVAPEHEWATRAHRNAKARHRHELAAATHRCAAERVATDRSDGGGGGSGGGGDGSSVACRHADAAVADASVLLDNQVYRSFSLPDCGDGYERNTLWSAHLMHWLDDRECRELVAMAEEHAAATGGWKSTRPVYLTTLSHHSYRKSARGHWWIASSPLERLLTKHPISDLSMR